LIAVELDVRDNGTLSYLKDLSVKVPKIGNREAWNLAQYGARELIDSAIEAGIRPWRKKLLTYGTGIEPRKLAKGKYGIFIPHYGIKLDRMPPHYVSLKRGRLIQRWAKDKLGRTKGSVFVRPHPFVIRGFIKMMNRADLTAKRIANKIVGG